MKKRSYFALGLLVAILVSVGTTYAGATEFSMRKLSVLGYSNGVTYSYSGSVNKKVVFDAYYDYGEMPKSYAWEKRADYITVTIYKKTKKWYGGYRWESYKKVLTVKRASYGNSFKVTADVSLPKGEYGFRIDRTDFEGWYDKNGNSLGDIILRGTVDLK